MSTATYPDIGLAVSSLLRSKTAITDLVGSRIYNGHVPQSAQQDGIVWWIVTEVPWMHLGGAMGIDQARIQFDAFSMTQALSNQIAWTIWTELDGFQGVSASVHIKGLTRASGVGYRTRRVQSGTDQYRFVSSQDLTFTYCSKELIENEL